MADGDGAGTDWGFTTGAGGAPASGAGLADGQLARDPSGQEQGIAGISRAEADRVGAGEWPADDNPLRNAPHTARAIAATHWSHPYDRETAGYPFEQGLDRDRRMRAVRGKY